VLIIPSVYLFDSQTASDLAAFVRQGGGAVFVDGPTPSIRDENIQALTGMRARGRFFERARLLVAVESHDLIPDNRRQHELHVYKSWDASLKAFRKQGINTLLQNVYQRAKSISPTVSVTITVAADQEVLNERHFLDWQTWIEQGYVDLVIPRAYADQDESLSSLTDDWRSAIRDSDRMMVGLTVYAQKNNPGAKLATRVRSEIKHAYALGSNGVILFDLEGIDDDLLQVLSNECTQARGSR
jgi:hypothetical protein